MDKFVYEDELTGLVYINWDEYLDHKEEFDTVGKELLATWFINGSIVEKVKEIGNKISTLTSWLDWVLGEYNGRPIFIEDEIYHFYQVKNLIEELRLFYRDTFDSNIKAIKQIIPFERIWDHYSTTNISMDDIFDDDWFRYTVRKAYERKVISKLETIKDNNIKAG